MTTIPLSTVRVPQIPVRRLALGIDVGCSPSRRSSAVCRLSWGESSITWIIERFRAVEPVRTDTIARVAGSAPILAAAFDGPLRRGLDIIGRYWTAERMLTRRLHPMIGKPGQASAPVGRLLNEHANRCAAIVLERCEVGMATHDIAIDDRGIVEAFPSSFMGVMLKDPKALNARRGDRSDTFFRYSAARGAFHDLVQHLLPGRSLASDPSTILNHDDRAGFVCALTALCVAAGEFTAVGDHDGWIILPPPSFVQPWAIDFLRANAAGEAAQAFYTTQAAPGA